MTNFEKLEKEFDILDESLSIDNDELIALLFIESKVQLSKKIEFLVKKMRDAERDLHYSMRSLI